MKTVTTKKLCLLILLVMFEFIFGQGKTITVLSRVEYSEGAWEEYTYTDFRENIFNQENNPNYSEKLPTAIDLPKAYGYTAFARSKKTPGLKLARPLPIAINIEYNDFGCIANEEWIYDIESVGRENLVYLYQSNKLVGQNLYTFDYQKLIKSTQLKYDTDRNLKEKIVVNCLSGFDPQKNVNYYRQGKLVKSEWTSYNNLHDGYTIYHYKHNRLIKEEKHAYGDVFTIIYKYNDDGDLIELIDSDNTTKYEYNTEGLLMREVRTNRLNDKIEIYSYYYELGLLVKSETGIGSDGIDIVESYTYDNEKNLIKREWSYPCCDVQGYTKYYYKSITLK